MTQRTFPATANLRYNTSLTWCNVWSVFRRDGVTLRLTDHDRTLFFPGSTDPVRPLDAASASTIRHDSALREANFDAAGVLTSDSITEDDIRAGRYDEARIRHVLFDWRARRTIWFQDYWVSQITFDGERWNFQLTGLAHFLQRTIGRTYERYCHKDLFDTDVVGEGGQILRAGCNRNPAAFRHNGFVATVANRQQFTDTGAGGILIIDDYYKYGEVEWTSGNNSGLVSNVAAFVGSSRSFTLREPLPYDIGVGDTYIGVAGCNKLEDTCNSKFSNRENFGGDEDIPGTDSSLERPKEV